MANTDQEQEDEKTTVPEGPGDGDDIEFYDLDDADDDGERRGPMFFILAAVVVVGFGAVIFLAYLRGVEERDRVGPPVLRAENTPVKVEPDDPGGLEVPHQDKLVYDRVAGAVVDTEAVEHLLPPAEEPLDVSGEVPDAEVDGPDVAALDEPSAEAPEPDLLDLGLKIEIVEPEVVTPAAPEPVAETLMERDDVERTAAIDASEDVTVTTVSPTGPFIVQLASLRDEDTAKSRLNSMRQKHGNIIAALPGGIQSADLGDKGMYYRVWVGGYATRNEATSLCSTLKKEGQECYVRRR